MMPANGNARPLADGAPVAPARLAFAETLHWRDAEGDPPDDEATVLIHMPGADEPVWMGYREDGRWYVVDGWEALDHPVVRWAELPSGSAS